MFILNVILAIAYILHGHLTLGWVGISTKHTGTLLYAYGLSHRHTVLHHTVHDEPFSINVTIKIDKNIFWQLLNACPNFYSMLPDNR